MAERETATKPFPTGLVTTGILVLLVAVGAATIGPLVFTGPRFDPNLTAPSQKPATHTAVPTPAPSATRPPAAGPQHSVNLTWLVIVVGVIVVALIAFLVIRWLRGRERRPSRAVAADLDQMPIDLGAAPDEPSIETSAPYLRRGLRRALDLLDGDRPPTDAIVEAWLGLQEAAEDAGHRRLEAETPTEFTTRILVQMNVDGASLDVLRRLYTAVRFGDRVATPADVGRARDALQHLADDWAEQAAGSDTEPPAEDGSGRAPEARPTSDGGGRP